MCLLLLANLDFLSLCSFLFLPLSPVQELLFEQGCLIVLRQAAKQSPAWTTFPFPGITSTCTLKNVKIGKKKKN